MAKNLYKMEPKMEPKLELTEVFRDSPQLGKFYKTARFTTTTGAYYNKANPITIVHNNDVVADEDDEGECDDGEEADDDADDDEGEGHEGDKDDKDGEENDDDDEDEEDEEEEEDDDEEEDDEEEEDACMRQRNCKKRKCTACDCDAYCECSNGFSSAPQPYVRINYNGLYNTSFVLTLCTGSMLGITFCLGLSMYIKILSDSLNTLALI